MEIATLFMLGALAAAPIDAETDACRAVFERAAADAPDAVFLSYVAFVPVRIAGEGPFWMLVDTGANRSALDAALARRLHLPELAAERVEGSAGVIDAGSTRIERLSLGPTEIQGLSPTTSDLSGLAGPNGEPVAGILGSDAFDGRVLLLDFAGGRVGLTAPGETGGCTRSLAFEMDNGIMRYHARIDGVPVLLRHDSGAGLFETDETYVNVTEPQFAAVTADGPARTPVAHFSGSGGGGEVRLPVYPASSLEIGPLTREAPRLIVQPPQGYFAREDAVGFVGNYVFWTEGAMLIDYAAGRVVLPATP